LDRPYRRRRVELPTYPFQRQRFEPPAPAAPPAGSPWSPATGHPLLGSRIDVAALDGTVFQARIGLDRLPYLGDHRIHGVCILPSPAYMETILAAAAEWSGEAGGALEDLVIHEPVVVPDEGAAEVQTVVEQDGDGARIRVFSRSEGRWRLHVTARAARSAAPLEPPAEGGLLTARAHCQQPVDVDQYYRRLEALGLSFGPRFRAASRIWRGDGAALGEMKLPAILRSEEGGYRWIHPALLDACLHVIGAALPGGGAEIREPFLLMGVDRIRFFERPATELWASIRLRPVPGGALETREVITADMVLYDGAGQPVASFEGLRCRRTPADTLRRVARDGVRRLFYEVTWPVSPRGSVDGPDVCVAEPADGVASASPSLRPAGEIAAAVLPGFDALCAANDMGSYARMLPALDEVAGVVVAHALRTLGGSAEPGATVTAAEVMEACGILGRHRRLVDRMLEMLAEDGVLSRDGAAWRVARPFPDADPARMLAELRARFPAFETEITLFARCCEALPDALRGDVDPLQLLFPGGSLEDAGKLYRETPSARTYNGLVRDAIATAIRDVPADRALRIIEIGAGTGGTTSHVLPILPAGRTEYVFTDVSPHFLNRARTEFASFPFVRYELLDITRDPEEQGFRPGTFDIVIAANVLHATPDLRQTLRNVARLLAPNGLLVLYEVVARQRFADLTVGLTEGWWAFNDPDIRPSYALLPRKAWRDVLAQTGFTGVAIIPGDDAEGVLRDQAVILAHGGASAGSLATPTSQDVTATAASTPRGANDDVGSTLTGSWLVFADTGGTGEALAKALRERGLRCVVVTRGAGFDAVRPDHIAIDPDSPDALRRLLAEAPPPVRGVVHLWSLDAAVPLGAEPEALLAACRRASGTALQLAQALIRAGAKEPPTLWLVTRGAQGTGDPGLPAPDPVQATTWGLSHTIAIEHPELRCTRVDLDPLESVDVAAARLAAEIIDDAREQRTSSAREDQIAFRGGRRRVRRVVRATSVGEPGAAIRFHAERTYLITGGLRGLGPAVAEWMVRHGARHLVLMGRNEPPSATREALERMRRSGAHVLVARGDVSRYGDLERILAEASRMMPPLAGVIHGAGVLDDATLLQQDWARFETVLAPKALGAWNLHVLTRGLEVDTFVLFSSGAGLMGAGGQANHSAANAFLDALAHHRRALGLPAVSINWGAWAEIGAAADRELGPGMRRFSVAEGLEALGRVLAAAQPAAEPRIAQVAVLDVDWHQALGVTRDKDAPPLVAELLAAEEPPAGPGPARPGRSLLEELEATPPAQRSALIQRFVRRTAADVLGLGADDGIGSHRPLQELGLDSLMAVELRNKLGQAVGRVLPATLLFEHPTVAALAEFLSAEVLAEPAPTPSSVGSESGRDRLAEGGEAGTGGGADLDDLSEDALAAMLLEKLERLDGHR